MTNIEALERLVGSKILSVKLLGSEGDPWGAEVTTTDGETIEFAVNMYEELCISVKEFDPGGVV